MLAWATGEARRNADKPAAELLTPPPGLRDKFLRLAQTDQGDTAARDRLARREEERKRQIRVESLTEANGVPPKYAAADLGLTDRAPADARPKLAEATADLASLLDRPGIIVLLGTRGAGKTHMACGLVNAFCREGRQAAYAKASDYFLRIDEAIAARESVLKVELSYLRPELLVLDAMEERADTPHKDRMLVRLIDKRYDANKSTVLISNETQAKFNERVGESVADRIREDGQLIECRWPSLRGRIG